MRWSYSSARVFRQCQRKWFYNYVMVAPGKLKDEDRLRARRLKHLSTLSSWRGQIVDTVISEDIILELEFDEHVTDRQAKQKARQLFDRQRLFAEAHRTEDLSLVKSHQGSDFLLLSEHAHGEEVTDEDYEQSWQEIVVAIDNLYHLDDLRAQIVAGSSFFPQPKLHFNVLDDIDGTAIPDLIIYTDKEPIQILDWKVHHDGSNDARGQLASYAIALSRMKKPNRDFPPGAWQSSPGEIILKEVQLLLGDVREHILTESDLEDAEVFMMDTAFAMSAVLDGRKYKDCDIGEFDVSESPETCDACAFRMICREDVKHA